MKKPSSEDTYSVVIWRGAPFGGYKIVDVPVHEVSYHDADMWFRGFMYIIRNVLEWDVRVQGDARQFYPGDNTAWRIAVMLSSRLPKYAQPGQLSRDE